jgi:Pectinacetylesterase
MANRKCPSWLPCLLAAAMAGGCSSSETAGNTSTGPMGGSSVATGSGGATQGAAGSMGTGGSLASGGSAGSGGTPVADLDAGGAPGSGVKIDVPPGDPITAPPMTWTAIPVAGTLCRNNQPTGFGVNINPASTKLIIYLEGGGACFNVLTCAQNPSAWAPTDATLNTSVGTKWLFSRSSADSPFKDWNLAYVPYCTGDVHTGSAMSGYMGQPQIGYLNYFKYLQRIVATFKNVDQVILSGASAGGFGVAFNWMLTQDAFGAVPVSMLDDSGPPMGPDYLSECQQQRVGMLWGWDKSLHPACKDCDLAAGKIVRPLLETTLKRQTTTRVGLLSYDEDGTIKTFFSYGLNNCAGWNALLPPAYPAGKYPMGLADLRQSWSPYPHAAMYVVSGGSHTFLGNNQLAQVKTGTGLTMVQWITKIVDKTDGWGNVNP